jgi:hypothetical protein
MSLQRLVGHNIWKFDLPYLIRSSVYNRVKIPPYLLPFGGKFQRFENYSIDTMNLIGAGEWGYLLKLETASMACGVSYGKTGSGKNFYKMPRKEQEEYLRQDLLMTEYLYNNIAESFGYEYEPIIFDIETCPKTEGQIEMIAPKFDPENVATGNLKDPEKIQAKIDNAETNHIRSLQDKAGLHAHYSQPCAIGYIVKGKVELDFNEPKELLTRFWSIVSEVWGNNQEQL